MRKIAYVVMIVVSTSCEGTTEPGRLHGSYSGTVYSAATNEGIAGVDVRLNRDTLLASQFDVRFSSADSDSDGRWYALLEVDVDDEFCATADSTDVRLIFVDRTGQYETEEVDAPFCREGNLVAQDLGLAVRMFEE